MSSQEKKRIFKTDTEAITRELGESLALEIKPGDLICLKGDLGAGKTCLIKGICQGLGLDPEKVSSPTFTLINEYHQEDISVFHIDLYRLEPMQTESLGLEEYFSGRAVSLVEWPDRLDEYWQKRAKWITISISDNEQRIFEVWPQ
jgi:tRNA threonylcarbamoyladenosine biosynthesis protein TsaE